MAILANRFNFQKGDLLDNKYEIIRTLGEGTFGLVYHVKEIYNPTEEKAVKVLKLYQYEPTSREAIQKRFYREYECGQIRSPYLIAAHDKGETHGNPYFAMEYCSGGSLKGWVGQKKDWNILTEFTQTALLGLDALNSNGIIHRDIKPDNILIGENNTAKLTDFGIAGFQTSRLTKVDLLGRAKGIFGTWAYIAPEQANSSVSFKTMAPTADIWSLGVTLYEIMCGQLPFGRLVHDADMGEYMRRVTKAEYDPIAKYRPDVPQKWVNFIEGSLEKDHKKRLKSAREALDVLSHQDTIVVPPTPSHDYDFDRDLFGLEIKHGEEPNRIYNLSAAISGPQGSATIGWHDSSNPNSNSLTIVENETSYISRFHATIYKDSPTKSWWIRDGQYRNKNGVSNWYPSTNNTYVNGEEVEGNGCYIFPNDIISIGDTTLKVIFQKR